MFAGGRDSSAPVPKCPRDTSALVPNCPDISAPVWWCQNVLGPKCPGSEVSWHLRYALSKTCRDSITGRDAGTVATLYCQTVVQWAIITARVRPLLTLIRANSPSVVLCLCCPNFKLQQFLLNRKQTLYTSTRGNVVPAWL